MLRFFRYGWVLFLLLFQPGLVFSLEHQCLDCHTHQDSPLLIRPVASLCMQCHADIAGKSHHPVHVPVPEGTILPLFQGKMECVSCHDPHQAVNMGLRASSTTNLCLACHKY